MRGQLQDRMHFKRKLARVHLHAPCGYFRLVDLYICQPCMLDSRRVLVGTPKGAGFEACFGWDPQGAGVKHVLSEKLYLI